MDTSAGANPSNGVNKIVITDTDCCHHSAVTCGESHAVPELNKNETENQLLKTFNL